MNIIDNDLNLAIDLHRKGDLNQAEKAYEELYLKDSTSAELLYFYSLLLVQLEKNNKAVTLLNKILEKKAEDSITKDSSLLLGEIYLKQNQISTAKKNFQYVLDRIPSDLVANFNMGNALLVEQDYDNAIIHYNRALTAQECQDEIYLRLIEVYKQKGDINALIECYKNLIQIQPQEAEYHYNLGLCHFQKNDFESAYKSFVQTIQCNPQHVNAYINIAEIFCRCSRLKQAEEFFLKAYELDKNSINVYHGLGNVYTDLGEVEKALKFSEEGLSKFPRNAALEFNLSRASFLAGDLDKGWAYFKHRRLVNENKSLNTYLLDYKGSLKNKKVLIYNDTGFGDSIQFLRYIPLLKETGAKIYLRIQPALENLVKSSGLDIEIVPYTNNLKAIEHDFHINLTSLAYLYKTDMDKFPYKDRYLSISPEKIQEYREKNIDENTFNIGIVWHSHINAGLKNVNHVKEFYPVAKIPGVKLYSLQQTKGEPMFEGLPEDFNIVNLGDDFKDFTDTAAAVENMDLLLTIDTAVAHLAGAMGKPAWVLIPKAPNWRWFMEGETTPWYDSMKLIRQAEEGVWTSEIAFAAKEIENLLKNK